MTLKIEWLRAHPGTTSHASVAIFMAGGMLAAWSAPFLFADPGSRSTLLFVSVIIASLPLSVELLIQVTKGNFGVDLLAFLSIAVAVYLHQYWVAAIVI